jgi:hypothetical protein
MVNRLPDPAAADPVMCAALFDAGPDVERGGTAQTPLATTASTTTADAATPTPAARGRRDVRRMRATLPRGPG